MREHSEIRTQEGSQRHQIQRLSSYVSVHCTAPQTSILHACGSFFLGPSCTFLFSTFHHHYSVFKIICREIKFFHSWVLSNIPNLLDMFLQEFFSSADYFIPRGWKVLPVLSAANLDPSLHVNSLQFHPWRWEVIIDFATGKKKRGLSVRIIGLPCQFSASIFIFE